MRADSGQKIVNLALQGGGSHGAFAWAFLIDCLRKNVLQLKVSLRRAPGQLMQ